MRDRNTPAFSDNPNERATATSDWAIVETMTGGCTVISIGGHQKEWISLRRARLAQRVRLSPTGEQKPVEIKRLIEHSTANRTPLDLLVHSLEGRLTWRLIIQPVPTAGGLCNAVQVWFADPSIPVKPHRSIAGLIWDFKRQICLQPYESTVMSGRESFWEGTEEVSLSRLLSLGERYDEYAETLELLFASEPGQRTQTHVTTAHYHGGLMRWQVNLVAADPGVLVVWEDVTDAMPVEPPTLQQIGLQTASIAGINVAVIAPAHGTLVMFLTPPPSWVQYIYRSDQVRVIHPDDVDAIQKAVASEGFANGTTTTNSVSAEIRLLATDDTYDTVTMNFHPYPGELGTGLVIGSFAQTERQIAHDLR